MHSYNGILLSNKNKWSTNTCYHIDGHWQHFVNERSHWEEKYYFLPFVKKCHK